MELSSHHGQEIGTFVILLFLLKTPQNHYLSIVALELEACGVQEIKRLQKTFALITQGAQKFGICGVVV